ncbi:MAG: hypothetical protein LBU21_01145, partial [Treponema sp.]|nr:hypothetical protein [Treponema sp.]
MAKISENDRFNYTEKTKPYQDAIAAILKREKETLTRIQGNPGDAALKQLDLVEEMLDLASYYIILNGVSQSMLKVKNEDALNDGRKALYKGVIYLEELVSNYVDAAFADYEERLAGLSALDAARRYRLIRKMGFSINLLEYAYGDNTKWKWSFVELEGRYAAVAKNILDLKNTVANMDPRSPDYESTVFHLRLVKKLLLQAADRYREKYELSTGRTEDFKQGINFLGALRRIHIILGDREEAEIVKKKLDIWSAKLER